MSLAVLRSRALAGMDAPAVSVEVHLANALPNLPSLTTIDQISTKVLCLGTRQAAVPKKQISRTRTFLS